jgi:DNA invertase Pin-like site-specific DNA recombinase
MMVMQAQLYTRVSTANQGFDSLDIQNKICLNYLNNKGIILSGSYQEVSSAYNGNQKILETILNSSCNFTLFVLNVSRFSRNILNGIRFLTIAQKNHINIHFIEEELDSNNSTHQHNIRVKLSEAQHESETLSRRINNRNQQLKKVGYQFGVAPFGNQAIIHNNVRSFQPNSDETKIINFIVQARDGVSCKILNNKLKLINPNADPIFFFENETKINFFDKPGTLTFQEIADILNDYDINKRGNDWTSSSVSYVYNQRNSFRENSTNSVGRQMTNMSLNI